MVVLLAFAFVSGVITILSPCILPVLPIVLSGGLGGGKARPLGVVSGFILSFTVFTLALSAIVQALGLSADALRYFAIAIIALFGLVMLVPALGDVFERIVSRIASRGSGPVAAVGAVGGAGRRKAAGFWGGLPVGLSLGLIWTPCVGPIMASVISLALSQKIDGGSVFITFAYTLGTSIPMLAVMLGGRSLLNKMPFLSRNTGRIRKGFGLLMLFMALAMGLQWDRKFQTAVLAVFPNYGSGLTALETTRPVRAALDARSGRVSSAAIPAALSGTAAGSPSAPFAGVPPESEGRAVLGDYGAAPPFGAKGPWFNSGPLDLEALRGKVVLVDFWTYSCVNCLRTIPYLKAWYSAYKDKGLVIVGVHSPEFAFEKVPANVSKATRDLGLSWPVVLDNDFTQWKAYRNQYWPAHYFIDAKGRVRYWHFGEGEYGKSEEVIKTLLAEAGSVVQGSVSPGDYALEADTPETYLGYLRGENFASAIKPVADKLVEYRPARVPGRGEWNLSGSWTIAGEYVAPAASAAKASILELGFKSKDVYLVIAPEGSGGSIGVFLDGIAAPSSPDVAGGILKPDSSRLYHLVALKESGEHRLKLDVKGSLRLFAFTFG